MSSPLTTGRAAVALAALLLFAGCSREVTAPTAFNGSPSFKLSPPSSAGGFVYNIVPSTIPPNVPSLGYQCCATAEFGDNVILAGTDRRALSATVLMSDWAKYSDYPAMDAAGYTHPITLNFYAVDHSGPFPARGAPLGSITQSFLIPWRPPTDPTCGDDAWRAGNGLCYHGFAFTITFDLRSLALTLPSDLIVGIAYNTNTWGYNPIGSGGPFESLNVGLMSGSPSVGTDVEPDAVFWNTSYAPFYTDGGAGGVGIFRRDTGWSGLAPAFSISAFTVAVTADDCKKDGWMSLARADATTFKNQGDCIQFVNTGK